MPEQVSYPTPASARSTRLPAWLVLPLAAAALVVMRLHAFGLPLEPDECNYAYIGSRLLAGDRLYVDVWDHQPPAVFALFAAVSAIFGEGTLVFRVMSLLFSLASLMLIYDIARRQTGPFGAGVAAIAFALLSSDIGTAGEGCNREIYMNTFLLAALAALSRSTQAPEHSSRAKLAHEPTANEAGSGLRTQDSGLSPVAIAGLLLGIASALKPVVAVQWLALAIWIAWGAARRNGARGAVTTVILFGLGPALVWLGHFAWFAATSRLDEFVDAVFRFNIGYAGAKTSGLGRFVAFFREGKRLDIFPSAAPLWLAGLLALAALGALAARRRAARPAKASFDGALMAYALGSYAAVCLPGHSWPHYYYLLIPPLVLVVAATFGRLSNATVPQPFSLYAKPRSERLWRTLAVVWLGLVAIWQVRHYLLVPTLTLTDTRYASRDLWGWVQGLNVASVTDPDDCVLVIGSDPGVYYYAKRRCATRYTMMTGLDAQHPDHVERRANVMADLQRHRPRLILVIDPAFPELHRFIVENYVQASPQFIDFHDERPTEPVMQALMDRTRPVAPIDWNWHRRSVHEGGPRS